MNNGIQYKIVLTIVEKLPHEIFFVKIAFALYKLQTSKKIETKPQSLTFSFADKPKYQCNYNDYNENSYPNPGFKDAAYYLAPGEEYYKHKQQCDNR